MALVQVGDNDVLEVPDDWGQEQVNAHMREVRPQLFAKKASLAAERDAAVQEGNVLDQYLGRLNSLGDAGVLERAGEMLARGGANIVSSASQMALAPIESLAQLLPDYAPGIRKLAAASSLGRLVDAGQAAKGIAENLPSRAPSFGEASALARNAESTTDAISPFLQFMANAAGENAPQLLGGSVIGKLLGGAAIPPKMMASAPGFFFRNAPLSTTARAAIGSAATVLPQEFGWIYESLREKGVSPAQATGIASLFAVPSTALETVSDIPVLSRILGEGSRSYAKVLPRALMQSQLEGATEAAQEAMAIDAETLAGRVPSQPEQIERYLGSALGGIAGGFGTSAATDVVGRFQYGASAGEPAGPQRILEPGPAVAVGPMSEATTSEPVRRFAKVAKKLGIPPGQIDFVDAPITDEERTSIGHTGRIQAYVTPENRIRVFAPEITSDSELREILREEQGHIKLRTPEGQLAFQKFNSENTLTPEELAGLSAYRQAEGETDVAYKARLNDEFLAKLERDSWWKKLTDRFVTFGKQALGLKLNNRQAGRLLLRNIGKTGLTAVTTPAAAPVVSPASIAKPPSKRDILKTIRLSKSVQDQFPGVVLKFNEENPNGDGRPISAGKDGAIYISPTKVEDPSKVRQQVMAEMARSGVSMFRDEDRDRLFTLLQKTQPDQVRQTAKRLGADIAEGDGRMKVLAEALSSQMQGWKRSGPLARKFVRGLRLAINRNAPETEGDQLLRALQTSVDTFRSSEPVRFEPENPEQVYADDHEPVWGLRTVIRSLRERASELGYRQRDRSEWKQLDRDVQAMADAGRSRQIGGAVAVDDEGGILAINPEAENFLDVLEQLGVQITQRMREQHVMYRTELEARAVSNMLYRLEALESTKGNLAGMVSFLKFTTYDPAQIEQEIKELQAAISKKTGERTDDLDGSEIAARANEILDSDRSLPRARAAKMVLEHPEVRRLTEILDRISESGLTPRPAAQLSDFHASRAEVAHDMLRAAYRGLQDAALREQAKFLHGQYASGVTGFKRRLTATLSKQGELEVAMSDIVRQLGRELGLSGSLRSPEAERVLRDEAVAISRLAIALAQADPDTPAGRLRENILMSPGSLLVPAQDLRVIAGQAGVSEEALSRVLKYIRDLPDLQHAVPQLFEASMSAAQNATITVLQKIEDALEDGTKEGDQLAKDTAEKALDRLRRTWERLARREANQSEHLDKLEQERLYHEALVEFAGEQMPDLQGVRRMTYQTEDGWKFVGFKLPEGGEQAEINIRVGQEYTQATLRQIVDWQANAMRAISAHSVDEQTRRGLSVGALMANEFLDQNFTHAQFTSALAPGSLMRLIDRTPLRTKENMAAYVPGLFGDRIRKTGKTWEDVGAQGDRLKARHVKAFHRLFWSAARSLGLNLNNPGDSQRMADAYNEVSHRLRQTNSGVSDGDQLLYRSVRGRTVTRELLNLIRYTRRIGRDGQALVKSSWYGGVRVDLPGRQVVRPPAETGDLGLGRLPDQQKAWDLAKRYRDSQGNDLAPELEQFWDADSDAVFSAMDDMDRSDFVLSADPLLKQLAGLAIRGIRMRGEPIPGTVQEWAERLASFMPQASTQPAGDPETVLKERLMRHLAQYGRVASTKHPDGSERPLRSTGVSVGESEASEFTKPASPVVYPGSWYNYGSSKGLGDFIGRMSDVSQVEYLNALKSASAHLKERARLVRASIESGELQKFAPDILFHTQGAWLSLMGKKLTPKRAESSARAMVQAANIMASEIAQIDRFGTPSISFVVNFIRSSVAWLLAGPSAAVTNVIGGPVASHPINVAMFGTGLGVVLTASQFAASSAHWLVDTIASIGRGVIPVELQPDLLAAHETHDFLEAHGIGTSYDRGDLAELEKFADGESGRSNTAKVFDASQQAASSTSEVIGVRLGDRILNRYAVRFVVPLYLFRLRQMAYAYVERLNKLGLRPDPANPETSFGAKDSSKHAYARELMGEIGNVDDIMWRLGNDEVDPRKFYRSELGRKFGSSIIFKFNASSRLNRPNSNGWLQLLGWTSHMVTMLATSARTTADTPVYKKVGQMLARTSATALALSLAYWIPLAARQGILGAASDSMRRISEILSGDEPPEDEQGMADWSNRMFAKLCAVLHNIPGIDQLLNLASATTRAASRALIPGAKVLPWQSSFTDRPASEIAKDLALSVPAGVGITLDGYRLPAIDLAYQGASAATQVGRGVLGYLSAHDAPGQEEAGKVDMVAGMKQALSLYGIAGRTLGEMILPATTEDRVGRRAILNAAADAGVQAAAPFQTQGFASPTPIRRTLMDAGRKMLSGDAQAEQTVLNMAQFVYDRAKNKSVNQGDDAEAAEKAGLSAVKNALRTLNPYEAALGRSITEEQFDALKSKLGKNAAVERDERAAEAVINSVASKYGFEVTTGMLTPTKKPPGSGRPRGGSKSRYGRRSLGRSGRSRYGRRSIGRSRRIS